MGDLKMIEKEIKKEKIRKRYKGIDPNKIKVIPAIPQKNVFDDKAIIRAAVYVRVSTDSLEQTSSFELQKNHYESAIKNYPGFELVNIYSDEGITGTSTEQRSGFMNMINDCLEHKIDIVITKSVSRFARNLLDCIKYVRKLKSQTPPIGIYFETEHIFTLDEKSEMFLAFMATHAQEESHNKSEIMNISIDMRFKSGIYLTPPLLGYDQDENGNLIINEYEAYIVKLVFFMYLYGYTCIQIADRLTDLECKTKKGNVTWSPTSILYILQNERYCGAVLARKTWTPNYLDHKPVKNRNNKNQYYTELHHEAIISKEDFNAVQSFIKNAKYKNNRVIPELKCISEGVLAGFVSVHTRWAGFKPEDYILASVDEICITEKDKFYDNINLTAGEFDFTGYEIARTQFFNISGKLSITISNKYISFSMGCIKKFKEIQYIDILISPRRKLLAIRPSEQNIKNSVRWSKFTENCTVAPKQISGRAFLPVIFDLFNWDTDLKYKIQGTYYFKENMSIIIFDINNAEILIPKASLIIDSKTQALSSAGNNIIGSPKEWCNDFGIGFYTYAQIKELKNYFAYGKWTSTEKEKTYIDKSMINVTSTENIKDEINTVIEKIKRNKDNEY